MRSRRAIVAALALIVVAVVIWKLSREPAPPSDANTASAPRTQPQTPNAKPRTAASAASTAAERSTLADTLNSPSTDIRADLRVVSEIIDAFRTNLPRDGNPVGNNAEVTAALTGRNKLKLTLIPPDHPAINRAGELCDRWGTPFFFHAEAANKMEIRSAGPDRKMWNDDDATFAP